MIEHVLEHGAATGEPGCVLFAHKETVYRRCGFQTVDTVVRGPIVASEISESPDVVPFSRLRSTYDAWSRADAARLRRDERRWRYWRWIPRTCEKAPGGYVCVEPHLCREAIVTPGLERWPVMHGTNWLGLESMTKSLAVPLASHEKELFVMSHSMPCQIQMYMTDQF
jgi:hypothetical protein